MSKKHACQRKTLKVKDILHQETAGVVFSLSTAFNLTVSEIEIVVSKVEIAVCEIKIAVTKVEIAVCEIEIAVSKVEIAVSETEIAVSKLK